MPPWPRQSSKCSTGRAANQGHATRIGYELTSIAREFAAFKWRRALIGRRAEGEYAPRITLWALGGSLKALISRRYPNRLSGEIGAEIAHQHQGLIACSIDDRRKPGELKLLAIVDAAGEIGQFVLRAAARKRYRDLAQPVNHCNRGCPRMGARSCRDSRRHGGGCRSRNTAGT